MQVNSSGEKFFHGHVAIQSLNGFRPEPGQRFRLISAGGEFIERFAGALNHTLYPDLSFELEYSEGAQTDG